MRKGVNEPKCVCTLGAVSHRERAPASNLSSTYSPSKCILKLFIAYGVCQAALCRKAAHTAPEYVQQSTQHAT